MSGAGRTGFLTRRILALGLLGWLAVRGGTSTRALLQELASERQTWTLAFTLTPEQRISRALWSWDKDLGHKTGSSLALHRALQTSVPPQATVRIAGLGSLKQGKRVLPLPHLCFPRRFELAGPLTAATESAEDYWLYLEREPGARRGGTTQLATGPDWSLWR